MPSTVVRNCRLEYRLTGDGPDVIWGHGLTSSMDEEDELALVDWSIAGAGHRVLRYDARGHGGSDSTTEPTDSSWEALARDQLALADSVGVGPYVAAGASMGAATALHAALIAPERVRALILVIPPTGWTTRAAQTGLYAAMAELVEAERHAELLAASAEVPPPDPMADEPLWTDRFERKLADTDPVRLARVFRGAGTADLPPPEAIATIAVPVLVLAWTGDATHPLTTAARLQELMPQTELVVATTRSGLDTWSSRAAAFLSSIG